MHARDAVHRDLKSKNVLLAREWVAKLCDLGMCSLPRVRSNEQGATGTFQYMAPEVHPTTVLHYLGSGAMQSNAVQSAMHISNLSLVRSSAGIVHQGCCSP